MATPTIFISYRREDTVGHAGRIFDRLVERFGKDHVYRDIDTISAGEDYVEAVRQKINRSDILLALIGPHWLTATDEEGRWRLADENDLVRVEIAAALDRNIRVIPVLLQSASIPKAKDLPGELVRLAQRNAIEIRDTNFDLDTSQLIEKIGPTWRYSLIRIFARWPVYAAVIILLITLLGVWIYPQIALTPEKARIQIVQMGLQYDANTFVERAKSHDVQAVNLFLRAGMDPDAQNNDGHTALMWATANGYNDLATHLVEKGADINKALPWAAGDGQKEILNFLLAGSPNQTALNQALLSAAYSEHTDILELLLDKGAEVNFIDPERGTTALTEASQSERIDNIRLLLARGADVNLSGSNIPTSALFVAAGRLNTEIVDLLLSKGANVNFRDRDNSTPLHEAIYSSYNSSSDDETDQKRLTIVQSLLNNGADLTIRAKWMEGWQPTPLLYAIDRNQPQIALWLIGQGAEINEQTAEKSVYNSSMTTLTKAIEQGMTEVVKALLDKGADVNFQTESGTTALLMAAWDRSEILPLLLAHGADASVVDNKGETALMKAARSRNYVLGEEDIRLLIKNGAKVNATDNDGWTALMFAASSGDTESARQLLNHGADSAMSNDEGDTALTIASREGHKKTEHLLKTYPDKKR